MATKKETVRKKRHKHEWETYVDKCWHCNSYETNCRNCDVIGFFDGNSILNGLSSS